MTAPRLASTQADPPRGWRPGLGAARRTGANFPLARQRVLPPTGTVNEAPEFTRDSPLLSESAQEARGGKSVVHRSRRSRHGSAGEGKVGAGAPGRPKPGDIPLGDRLTYSQDEGPSSSLH